MTEVDYELDFKNNLFKYKWLLQELVIRDLKIKYRRSVLGYLWSVLNPLLMMLVLTVVFSTVFRFDIPNYPVYVLTGQLLFSFYNESTTMAMDSILTGASLIKKYICQNIFSFIKSTVDICNYAFFIDSALYCYDSYRCGVSCNVDFITCCFFVYVDFFIRCKLDIICVSYLFSRY